VDDTEGQSEAVKQSDTVSLEIGSIIDLNFELQALREEFRSKITINYVLFYLV
jgi:hypothetical protein